MTQVISQKSNQPTLSTGDATSSREPFQADSLAVGLFVLLTMSLIQRSIGFARSIGFCRFLDEETLGQWAMALSFINLITPMFLLGLPGSIVRYVEHYRRRGQLQCFIHRVVFGTAVLTLIAAATMTLQPKWFASLIFREETIVQPIAALSVGLIAIVVFNFLEQLVSGLRQVRVASVMQFVHSVGFTVLSLGWLMMGGDFSGLILTFALAAFIGCLPAVWILMRDWRELPRAEERLTNVAFVQRIAPYALSLWAINLIGNLFDISDRYMILHFSSDNPGVGQAMVGEYFSARMLPVLLLSLGVMISGVLMPYLTADWESGHRRRVVARLNKTLLLISGTFTFCSAIGMLAAPWMFTYLLDGRYAQGLDVMPITFIFCAWSGLILVAQDYLWCAEKGKLVGIALAIGLGANIVLNAALLPHLGLYGAVLATTIANLLVLMLVLAFMWCNDFTFDHSLAFVLVMPATLIAGPVAALAATLIVAAVNPHAQRYLRQVKVEVQKRSSQLRSVWT
ncbi:MAG: oligosaccharide flippase family protein [Pirellulaceae bacterium]